MLSPEHQNAWMSKITNDGLTPSGTGCFMAVAIWHQWASKGYWCKYMISVVINSFNFFSACCSSPGAL